MYDIDIILPLTTSQEKYRERARYFKKYGLINIPKESKVCISLLLGPDESLDVAKGWPPGIDIKVFRFDFNHETSKTYRYYSQMNIESKWIARFDDDSITNIGNLLSNLSRFDHQEKWYLVAELTKIEHIYEAEILSRMGYEHWFNCCDEDEANALTIWHEYASCVLSFGAMQTIIENSTAVEFFKERSKVSLGPNDYALSCAAKLCGIYPVEADFMATRSYVTYFLNERLTHIHFISNDCNSTGYNYLIDYIKGAVPFSSKTEEKYFESEFADKKLAVFRHNSDTIWLLDLIELKPNGFTEGSILPGFTGNLSAWRIYGKNITMFSAEFRKVITINDASNTELAKQYTTFYKKQFYEVQQFYAVGKDANLFEANQHETYLICITDKTTTKKDMKEIKQLHSKTQLRFI